MKVLGKLWHWDNKQKCYDGNEPPRDGANSQCNYPSEFMLKPAHSDDFYIKQCCAILT